MSTRTLLALIILSLPARLALAEPTPQQELYWWQDEMREVAIDIAMCRSFEVSKWPQIAVETGSAELPLPVAAGEITCDGKLDEASWDRATSFPVGPIFDNWRAGPFTIQVSVCRDAKNLHLAIESPRDLTELGSLTPEGGLFTVGKTACRLGPGGNIPKQNVGQDGDTHILELTFPLAGNTTLSFSVENLRYQNGKLPPETAWLGLDKFASPGTSRDHRKGTLWLKPITVKLIPSKQATRLRWVSPEDQRRELKGETVSEDGKVLRRVRYEAIPHFGSWAAKWMDYESDYRFKFDAFDYCYGDAGFDWTMGSKINMVGPASSKSLRDLKAHHDREIMAKTDDDIRRILDGAYSIEAARRKADPVTLAPEDVACLSIDEFYTELKFASQDDPAVWRAFYCRFRELRAELHLSLLDAPLLFVKRHPYFAGHIYDDYYTWHPGGGIYIRNKPQDGTALTDVRPVIDPTTNETLGAGVYRDPDLSWNADELVFAYRPDAESVTSIYKIGLDGAGLEDHPETTEKAAHGQEGRKSRTGLGSALKRLTASDKYNDITPAWLPDGRIVFTSTRPKALVPCFNSGVDTLHTMNADGSNICSISSNNVNEFDPAVLPDGRVLYGRWEYVDKTALYMQSLWTVSPDGRMEEALYGNNMAKPTAILDARPVPDSHKVVASLTPHNGQAVGAVGLIDTKQGKNELEAITNYTPEYPIEMDQGLRTGPCDPWPVTEDDVLISNNAIGSHGIIELIDQQGHRELVHCDPEMSCFAPMLVKPRERPPTVSQMAQHDTTGKFLLVDVYQGLEGVERGKVKKLRILEETARTSGLPPGGRWWNQAFLVSWQGAYIVKNILGTVPVHEDGSAYFEVPAGRAVYFEALDEDGREIQRMRTFVQATAGTTRSCVGCHESKKTTPIRNMQPPLAMLSDPATPETESWGSGYVDYPTMIQPILDRHCVRCHGGEEGIGHGLDFSGGWTWAFNIGYETLIKHRMVGFLNCHNSSVHTSEILAPGTIGSGAAHLADVILKKHPEVSEAERELLFAWMDTNSNYYGTWDYTQYATCDAILKTKGPLTQVMKAAGCTDCHAPNHIGSDWVNLQTPEWSRILRAPMAKSEGGLGVEFCRDRKAVQGYPLVTQAVQPPDVLKPSIEPEWDPGGEPHVTFASTDNPHYQTMLDIIRQTQAEALARPRVDMPGAEVVPGHCRMQIPIPVPSASPKLTAKVRDDGTVELAWPRTAMTIGLQYELHRSDSAQFTPGDATQIGLTTAGRFLDMEPPEGTQHYALLVSSGEKKSRPVWTELDVPAPQPPAPPIDLVATPGPGEVRLTWRHPSLVGVRYNVYRRTNDKQVFERLNDEPLAELSFTDRTVTEKTTYIFTVRAVNRRGMASEPSGAFDATPLPLIREPVFSLEGGQATLLNGSPVKASLHRGARAVDGTLELGSSGFATFPHRPEFNVGRAFAIECWVRIDKEAQMPVVLCCGAYNRDGWFLQRYGRGWRWHIAPVSCDGGQPVVGRWMHLAGTFDGTQAHLYQDGKRVASVDCHGATTSSQPLVVGQYSGNGPAYQVNGDVTGVKIYHRALTAEEVAEKAVNRP